MDLRSRQSARSQPRQEAPASYSAKVSSQSESTTNQPTNKKKQMATYGLAGIIAVIVLGLAVNGAINLTGSAGQGATGTSTVSPAVASDRYQAVFLTNGQVYFGKISSMTSATVTMEDIYYLQQGVQGQDQADEQGPTSPTNTQLQLTKLGKELHGPEDIMYIERSQVLFWENLRDDSEVVKNIELEKKQNNN